MMNVICGLNDLVDLFIQDRHATGRVRPIVDNTTTDWFGLQGREQNGWTAIRFRRLLDTCDPMDVPIKVGSCLHLLNYLLSIDLVRNKCYHIRVWSW